MKKLILCLALIACGFAVQAADTKSPKDHAAKAAAVPAKSECCDAKKEAAACSSCCSDTKTETKKQTTMLRSPKHAADKSA